MYPELTRKKFCSSIDYNNYYSSKLSEFITLNNNNSKETLTKYNLLALRELKGLLSDISNCKVKYGVICYLLKESDALRSFRISIDTLRSLGKQKGLALSLIYTLRHSELNEQWYKIIHKHFIDKTKERCTRLLKYILPELVKTTELFFYQSYCIDNDLDFEEELVRGSEAYNEDFKVFADVIHNTVQSYLSSLPEGKRNWLEITRGNAYNASVAHSVAYHQTKQVEKANSLKKRAEEVAVLLQRAGNDYIEYALESESIFPRFYEYIKDKAHNCPDNDNIVALASAHARAKSVSQCYFLDSRDATKRITTIVNALVFYEYAEKDLIDEYASIWKDKGYVVELIHIPFRDMMTFASKYRCSNDTDINIKKLYDGLAECLVRNRCWYVTLALYSRIFPSIILPELSGNPLKIRSLDKHMTYLNTQYSKVCNIEYDNLYDSACCMNTMVVVDDTTSFMETLGDVVKCIYSHPVLRSLAERKGIRTYEAWKKYISCHTNITCLDNKSLDYLVISIFKELGYYNAIRSVINKQKTGELSARAAHTKLRSILGL